MTKEQEEIDLLRARVAQLEAERDNWLDEKVYTVQKVKTVEPSDYRDNKKRLKELESKCRMLEKVMRYGNISSVNDTINEYEAISKSYLDKIVVELEYSPAGEDEYRGLKNLLEYMQSVQAELQAFLVTGGVV